MIKCANGTTTPAATAASIATCIVWVPTLKMTDGDSLAIAAEPLAPQNNITTGTITRAYNQTCQGNPESVFQAAHKNWNLPLVSSNVEPKSCSLTDISILRKAANTESEDVPELEGIKYVLPKPIEKFNRRLDEDVFHPNIASSEFKGDIALREFCDKFNSNLVKKHGEENSRLYLSKRNLIKSDQQTYQPIILKPFFYESNADPKSSKFWYYCKIMCLWCIPCKNLDQLMPNSALSDTDLKDHWINKYYTELATNPHLLPKWARAFHDKYHHKIDEASSSSDSDSDDV